jgi:hypothetical protein
MVLEQIVALFVDLVLGLVSTILLLVGIKILTPSWAISSASTHLICSLTLERSMVLDYTQEILSSPFISDVVIASSITTMPIES